MDTVITALREQQQELSEILRRLTATDWDNASACAGWNIADVVVHLIQTNDLATASAQHRFPQGGLRDESTPSEMSIDDLAALAVAGEANADPAEILTRWETGADQLATALGRCGHADRLQWVAGTLSARTLATTRLAETWIHTGDVASGLGIRLTATDRLWHIARLAWRTIPYSFQREGREPPAAVAFDLVAPNGDRWQFGLDTAYETLITGSAEELCHVASRRLPASQSSLTGIGPSAEQVVSLVRTWA